MPALDVAAILITLSGGIGIILTQLDKLIRPIEETDDPMALLESLEVRLIEFTLAPLARRLAASSEPLEAQEMVIVRDAYNYNIAQIENGRISVRWFSRLQTELNLLLVCSALSLLPAAVLAASFELAVGALVAICLMGAIGGGFILCAAYVALHLHRARVQYRSVIVALKQVITGQSLSMLRPETGGVAESNA